MVVDGERLQQRKQAMEVEIKRSEEEKKRNLMNAVSVLSGSPVATSTTPTATPFAPQVGRTPLGIALPVAGRPLPGVAPSRPPQAVAGGAGQAPPAIEVDGEEEDEDDDLDDEEDEEEFEKWAATEGAALLQTPGGAELKTFNSKLEEIKERSRQRKARSVAR